MHVKVYWAFTSRGAPPVSILCLAQPRLAALFRNLYVLYVNTYRAISTEAGRWGVQWLVDGVPKGVVWGSSHPTEQDAECAVFDFSLMEYLETRLPDRPSTGKRRQPPPAPHAPSA